MGLQNLCSAIAILLMSAVSVGAQPIPAGKPLHTIPAADIFAGVARPVGGPAAVHGTTSRGCFTGGVALADEGATWQVMRPSRNRYYAHPRTVATVERLAALAPSLGLRGILVGDLSQPAGGPMPWGHASHQSGLDADIWFADMPEPRLTAEERETIEMQSMLTPDGKALDTTRFTAPFARLVAAAAKMDQVQRIFVHPQIKLALCQWDGVGDDRSWLRKVRPWYGHYEHFHMRLFCPAGMTTCREQNPPPPGDGCGADLEYWFTPAPYAPAPKGTKKRRPLTVADLPAACARIFGG